MTLLALILVLGAAFVHATWNFLAKRVGGGAPFVWLFGTASAVIYAPIAVTILVVQHPKFTPMSFVFMVGSSLLHLVYFVVLQRGYKVGDLSLVYPLARGTGPMLSTLAAIWIFAERPSPFALAGAGLVVVSVFLLAGGTKLFSRSLGVKGRTAIIFGLTTGVLIATYTLWDKYAVSSLLIPPLVLDWASSLGRAIFLAPIAFNNWDEVKGYWRDYRRDTLIIAVLNSLSYILVLTALTFSPVSYIAPAREVSILIGAIMGATLLKEGDVKRRLLAASLMVLGVVALALG
jgi:drug/metabolite transporter (DMT)-like permease